MSEEIKEILRLNCEEEIDVKYFAKDGSLVDTTFDYSQLLDYIDNLQQKVEQLEKENKELNNIINYIWEIFKDGFFEDGCDCIEIYDYLKKLKENK